MCPSRNGECYLWLSSVCMKPARRRLVSPLPQVSVWKWLVTQVHVVGMWRFYWQSHKRSCLTVSRINREAYCPGGGGVGGVTPLYRLYGDVPLDRIWFLGLLPWTGYIISSESVLDRPRQGMATRLSSSIWQSEIREVCIYFSEQCVTSIKFPPKVHRC